MAFCPIIKSINKGIVFLASLTATPLIAQIDTTGYHELRGVEVVEKRRVATTRVGTPLQVLDRKGIERLGVQDLSEAVKRFSGVTVQDYGGIGGLKTVSVRSLGAKHTAVSYDGVTITDASSGQVDISRFTLDNVEMVSLTIGQSDEIFQPARLYASAGALQIQTAKPRFKEDESFNGYVKVKGGSFGLINPVAHFAQQLGSHWSGTLHADFVRADGRYPYTLINGDLVTKEKRKNSDTQSYHLEGNLFGQIGQTGEMVFKVYYFDSERGLPGSINLYKKEANERVWDNNFFVQGSYKQPLSRQFTLRTLLKYNYAFTRYLDVSPKYPSGKQIDCNTQNEYYGSIGLRYQPLSVFTATLTTDLSHSHLANNYVDGPNPKRWNSQSVAAIQYNDSRLTATASLLATYMIDKVQHGEKPTDKKKLSPAFSLSWRPLSAYNWRIRGSYKDIFRVPTFTDLYYLRMGNTALVPEKARQFNIGTTWSGRCGNWLNQLSLSMDGYYNKIKDKIVAVPTMYIWKMMNVDEVTIKGTDVNLSATFPLPKQMELLFAASYSYQYAVDVTDPEAKNYKHQIPYTPRHTGNASLTWENPWVNLTYLLSVVGDRYALPQNIDRNRIEGYVEQSITLNHTFALKRFGIRLQGELLNLANVNYDVIQYYPMPGRSWRLSVCINY